MTVQADTPDETAGDFEDDGPQTDWGSFDRQTDDGPLLVSVDMAWEEATDRPPHFIQAVSTYEPEGDDGLPSAEDWERLNEEDEKLTDLAAESEKLVLVGAWLHAGKRTRFFYGTVPDAGSVLTRVSGVEVFRRPDPEWTAYEEKLLPDEREYQVVQNNTLIEELQEDGLDTDEPVPLSHFFLFKTMEAAEEAATALDELGFRTVDFDEKEGEYPERLTVTRDDPAVAPDIHTLTLSLLDYAAELDGIYDGWDLAEED